MASGQVIGRHEVFEYQYRVGPADDRKRIKLVVIQRRDQRRKSLIAAQQYLQRAPVKLRVNLQQQQYGDPEVTSGRRHVPITLRRKVKAAPTQTITRVHHARDEPAVIALPGTTRSAAPTTIIAPGTTAAPTTVIAPGSTHTSTRLGSVPPSRVIAPSTRAASPLGTHVGSVPGTYIGSAPLTRVASAPSTTTEPRRIELVDKPIPRTPTDDGRLVADPDPILVVPSSSDPGHETPPVYIPPSPSQTSLDSRRKVTRSNSGSGSRFSSLMGLFRRNSNKSIAPPPEHHQIDYFDSRAPRTPGSHHTIIEERESELGSPIGPPTGYGPPLVAVSRKAIPAVPESPPSTHSGRTRAFSIGRRPSVSGSPRNKLIKPSPRSVPLPDSVRDPSMHDPSVYNPSAYNASVRDGTAYHPSVRDPTVYNGSVRDPTVYNGSVRDPTVYNPSAHPSVRDASVRDASVRDTSIHNPSLHNQSVHNPSAVGSPYAPGATSHIGSEYARSVHSRRTERSAHATPEYTHDPYLHDSPSAHSKSLRAPSMTQHSMRDGSVVMRDEERSLRAGSRHSRSTNSARDRSMHPSEHRVSARSIGSSHSGHRSEHSAHRSERSGHRSEYRIQPVSEGYHSPPLPDEFVRDPSYLDGERENDHAHEFYDRSPRSGTSPSLHAPSNRTGTSRHVPSERGPSPLSHRSPSLHAPSAHRAMSPSLRDPHSRVASPLSHRDAPSIHALSNRTGSARDRSGSVHRGASPSLHAPSYRDASPEIPFGASPPASVHAPSRAPSAASSKVPMSVNRSFARPKSPLSASGESYASSRKTNGRPVGPEITPVPMSVPPSARSATSHKTGGSRSTRAPVDPPAIPTAPSVAESHRSGRASEAAYRVPLPESVPASEYGSRIPRSRTTSAAGFSRAPTITRVPTTPSAPAPIPMSRAPSAAAFSRAVTTVPASSVAGSVRAPSVVAGHYAPSEVARAPSAMGRSQAPSARAPSRAGTTFAPSVAGTNRAPSRAGTTIVPSAANTVRGSPSVAGTTRAPSRAGTILAPSAVRGVPSVAGTARAPSVAGTTRAPSVAPSGIPRAPSAAGTHRAPSVAGTHRAPSVAATQRTPSVAGTQRAPSMRAPSVAATQRGAPSPSARGLPSIAGSAPSVTGPSRTTPPPELGAAPNDIAPESESHGGAALRAQARLEGEKMEMAFQASQEAYQEGDGERARELSALGHSHQARMQELHAEAAEQVFKEKNGDRAPDEIDLHGLYVKEAVSRLSQFIRDAPTQGQTNLRVITGKGLHSEGDPKIRDAVVNQLRSKGLQYHIDDTNSGVVVVELGPRSPVSD